MPRLSETWAYWLPLVATGAVVVPGDARPTHIPGLLGPAVAAFILTRAHPGASGVCGIWPGWSAGGWAGALPVQYARLRNQVIILAADSDHKQ